MWQFGIITAVQILVAGATGGIGGAVAEAARAAGHIVVEWNRADFQRGGNLPDGPYDAFLFAVGTCPVAPVGSITEETLAETMRVNCWLFVGLVHEIVRRKLYSPDGMKVVAVSSVSASEGWAGGVAYCASKGALSAACRAMDVELSPRGISVSAIEPRYVRTRMFRNCAGRMGVPESEAMDPRELAEDILKGMTK
jgi:NAD(P)-dependent dehydrogenase (short-subunit alcohol dehydrogenase family)